MPERQYATEPGWYWIKWPKHCPTITYLEMVGGRMKMWEDNRWGELPLGSDVRGPLQNPFLEEKNDA